MHCVILVGEWRVDTAKDEPTALVDVYHVAVSRRWPFSRKKDSIGLVIVRAQNVNEAMFQK